MRIRQENGDDFAAIYTLVKVAFETAEVSDGDEQEFANRLRNSEGYVRELALVAEQEGRLIGHIMLTKLPVVSEGGVFEGLLLGPISVQLEYRNQGVGSALINESTELAKKMGFHVVFLVGNPKFYERFGFRPIGSFGIGYTPERIPPVNVMALELTGGALSGVSGTVHFVS